MSRLALALGALGFVGFGAVLLVAPALLDVVGLDVRGAAARSDVRAVYGGMELGVGVFLASCVSRPSWHHAGLAVQALARGGAVAGRLVSLALDGGPNRVSLVFLAVEAAGAALALAALRARSRAAS